ncbi:dienelactone hydrolase family protein [Longimicrobium sp.]|uniref:dienelactone hydrolase family protein n=1 Tax=Longimicrobium sp. TaxID=2029185 RepID=UPI003B3B5E7E
MIPTLRTARFLRAYLRGGAGPVTEHETHIEVNGERREATLYLPRRPRPAPGWVVLHGLTVPGRHHKAMKRFVRSLAASGAVVLVPDVPAWRELRLDLDGARDSIVAGARFLAQRPEVRPGGVGTVGFSFGATHALMAAADPRVQRDLRAVVAFGGYCDVRRMVRCTFTGEHEWEGAGESIDPDPYGRWMLAANFLTDVPGFEGMEDVRAAAHELALEAGRRGVMAWDAEYDEFKREIRGRLSPASADVWDLLAPPTGTIPADLDAARRLADALAEAMMERFPGLDPQALLPAIRGRIILSHGRADRLIPYTETLRLRTLLPSTVTPSVTITGLFAHSAHAGWMHPLDRVRETAQFIRLLNDALGAM